MPENSEILASEQVILKASACMEEEAARKRVCEAVEHAQTEADAILFSHKPEEEQSIARLLLSARIIISKPVVLTSLGAAEDPQPPVIVNQLLLGVMLAPQLNGGIYKLENNRAVAL